MPVAVKLQRSPAGEELRKVGWRPSSLTTNVGRILLTLFNTKFPTLVYPSSGFIQRASRSISSQPPKSSTCPQSKKKTSFPSHDANQTRRSASHPRSVPEFDCQILFQSLYLNYQHTVSSHSPKITFATLQTSQKLAQSIGNAGRDKPSHIGTHVCTGREPWIALYWLYPKCDMHFPGLDTLEARHVWPCPPKPSEPTGACIPAASGGEHLSTSFP